MHSPRLLYTLSLILLSVTAPALTPRLTVVMVVEGLTQDNLDEMRPYWDAGGLRQLSEEAFQTTLSFPHHVYGGSETVATLMTGTTPQHHGIECDTFFSRTLRLPQDVLFDPSIEGIGTTQRLSPRALNTASITDRWRMKYGTEAKIYAIGIHSHPTILMAGHAANSCCWLQPDSAKWVTTSFYPEGLPEAADWMNMSGRITESAAKTWTPRLDISMYNHPTAAERRRPFSYNQKDILTSSPIANTLVIELALQLQQMAKLGTDNTPDILLLNTHVHSPKATGDAIASAEQEDLYLWLNQDIGYLMQQLDQRIGRTEYQLLVVGCPSLGISPLQLSSASLPIQRFNVDRAAALTSTYLMALYGHERWVDGGFGPYIYLNRTLIEQKHLSLAAIRRQVADFIMDFEGVQVAFPIQEAFLSDMAPSIFPKHAGDVVFELQDYWILHASDSEPIDRVIQSSPTAPLLFWSGSVRSFPQGPLSATDLPSLLLP